jgi:hypothetical protein
LRDLDADGRERDPDERARAEDDPELARRDDAERARVPVLLAFDRLFAGAEREVPLLFWLVAIRASWNRGVRLVYPEYRPVNEQLGRDYQRGPKPHLMRVS